MKPTRKRADPDEETIDWRAVCGRTARTVRREGRVWKRALLYPYSAMDGKLEYIHVAWIPAIPAGMTGFVTLLYSDES
jgi:hypothetical protein